MSVEIVQVAPNHLLVKGPLTFETARRAREVGERLIRVASDSLEVDCSGVNASDSAGLAVLIDWLATAKAAGRSVRFQNLPPGIQAAARISEVESILGI
jgi:phospholipid transport system transporter-binding protein